MLYEIATIVLIPLLILTIAAGINVRRVFSKYDKLLPSSGLTAAQAARAVLDGAGASNVMIKPCRGNLTDHYDPRDNTVYLSDAVYLSRSVAAIGIAAHEAGHAVQYASDYAPVKLRGAMVPVVSFASRASIAFILAAVALEILAFSAAFSQTVLLIGIVFYGVYTLFTIITLPVELNASSRAKTLLVSSGILNADETAAASRVLTAAALTYVASMAMSIIQLLRFIGLFGRRR
ncbi:MAG: zinc metallopeptidase [Clostridiales bacterium]|jgi:Zn-dependent membrane protease YugP|nr:zinc metallopeptidase [Clostridiales bacterium]